jgi:general secretion pathway protein E/type IV pilus assembly protein PilB
VTSNDDYVLEVIEEKGIVTAGQIELARESSAENGGSVIDALVRDEIVSQGDILGALAEQFGMDVVTLVGETIPPDVISALPVDLARRYKVVPINKHDNTLVVALGDPLDMESLDNLRHILKCDVQGVVAPPDEIKGALERYYAVEASMEAMLEEISDTNVDMAVRSSVDQSDDSSIAETDAPIIRLVSLIILEAHRNRASDIHLEPMERRFRVRYRIDGVLHEVDSPPKRLQSAILSRVKLMAGMKLAEKRTPQDGRIEVNIRGRQLDLRVSTVPGSHGESIVMRILDKQSLALGLPELGFLSDDQRVFEQLIQAPDGIILVTGPTGSGKTTTLYACLNYINRPDRKIITVEDPVEYQLSGVNQVNVREDIGLTFAGALRSILRQAPNIVMIGEIRDFETANIATEASLTGHLVFSTLHTNDAPSAITRLLDIGIKPFLVASSVRAAMAQRLVRCHCKKCAEERAPTQIETNILSASHEGGSDMKIMAGRGCNECALTGYKGRKGIFEIFHISEDIQRMIFEKLPASELRIRARESGMRTLREDGMRKVISGMTSLDEILRVTMGDID